MTKEERKEMCDIHYGMVETVVEAVLMKEFNARYRKYRQDIYGIAYLTLVKASEKFDDKRGFQFRTYASNAIRYVIFRFLKKMDKQEWKECYIEDLVGTPMEPRTEEKATDSDEYKALVKRLEPEDELDKIVYQELIIGDNHFRQLAEQLGIKKPHVLYKRKQKIIKQLKKQLENKTI